MEDSNNDSNEEEERFGNEEEDEALSLVDELENLGIGSNESSN